MAPRVPSLPDLTAEETRSITMPRKGFTAFHTDLWRQKQERAFAAWLNMVFLTQITCCAVKSRVRAWNDCQFDAKVQNKLWDYYTKNETLRRAMLNVAFMLCFLGGGFCHVLFPKLELCCAGD